jgi:hypothetical protein
VNNWIPAAEIDSSGSAGPLMGISIAKPGTKPTACGKGYWKCGAGEPAELTLKRPGIDFFRFESASSTIYWDDAAGKFKRVQMSD